MKSQRPRDKRWILRSAALLLGTLAAAGFGQAQSLPAPPSSPALVINYEYDAQGNPTKTVLAPGVAGFDFGTSSSYDRLNRRKDATDARSGVTSFGYNGREDLTSVTDPRSLATQYPRNGLGDATQLISPDTGTAGMTYNALGNVLTRTDSRGVLATYGYDPLNRLTSVVFSKSGSPSRGFSYTYDQTGTGFANGIGRLTSTTAPEISTQYAYDPQGRITIAVQRVNAASGANSSQLTHTVSYAYDTSGRVVQITYPSGRVVEFTYVDGQLTALGLKANAGASAVNLINQIQWEPFGGMRSWQWQLNSGTLLNQRYYDSSGRLVRYRLGNVIRDISYDAADRISAYIHYDATTAAAQPSLDQSFGYDQLGRLTAIATSSTSWSVGYDANGNRSSVTQGATTRTYSTATTSNRLNALTNPALSFGYDPAGNILTGSSAGNVYTATYGLENRLATMKVGNTTTTYAYNAMGQRGRKYGKQASSTVIFAYDQQGHLLGEYTNTGAAIREYVWLGDEPVAVFTPNVSGSPDVYYVHSDHLGAPRLVTDKNNAIRWRWLAEPFGTTAPETNPQGLGAFTYNLRLPGQYADAETGLYYNYFRDYDSSLGRYTQSDPIGLAGGINTYAYVGGNPISYVDPLGLYTEVIVWQATNHWGSQFGHVSTNINGRNYSFGPGGWDRTYPTAAGYAARQQSFRSGSGTVLGLSNAQEAALEQCMKGAGGAYSSTSNNCGTSIQSCLAKVGVNIGNSMMPFDISRALAGSPASIGQTFYSGPSEFAPLPTVP
jgi:RHS repeat-associated protein